MSKTMKSFRLDTETTTDLGAIADYYGCSQADVITASVELFGIVSAQLEEVTRQRIEDKRGECDYTPSLRQMMQTAASASIEISA